jgi:hypothetical protein
VLAADRSALERVAVYRQTITTWWVARLVRLLYERPRGADARLAPFTPGQEAEARRNYARYLALANELLDRSDTWLA